ncbi:MAG: amidohydrolase family protein, partial [Lachnospiraceae bacterium]|nr:amidohydrolase family protein [Lachnospiraceae bacterium]
KVFSLPEAIHHMTGRPAQRFRIPKRGLIKEGYYADFVVFDSTQITDHTDFMEPGKPNEGIHLVFVNRKIVMKDGIHQKVSAGMVIDWKENVDRRKKEN